MTLILTNDDVERLVTMRECIDIIEEEVTRYPGTRNVADMPPDDGWAYEPGTVNEGVYFQTRLGRRRKLRITTSA